MAVDTQRQDVMMNGTEQPLPDIARRKKEFLQVLRDVEVREGKPLEDLLKTDMDRMVSVIGDALLEKFPGIGR